MESKRQLQVGELLKRHFSTVLQQEGLMIYGPEPMVSVTSVKISPDFSVAKVYLSVFNTENKQAVLLSIHAEAARLRGLLAARVGKQMRRIPALSYFLDETIDEMYRIDALLDKVRQDDGRPAEDEA